MITRSKRTPNDNPEKSLGEPCRKSPRLNAITNSTKAGVEEDYLLEKVLSIPLILKNILENLSVSELLENSVISKYWCYLCRELLRQKHCSVIIKESGACSKLAELVDFLKTTNDFPFSGLSITVPQEFGIDGHKCLTCNQGNVRRIRNLQSSDFENFKLKSLSLKVGKSTSCNICLKFIQLILTEKASSLECLSINVKGQNQSQLKNFNINMEGQWLPKLRRLEFPYRPPNLGCPDPMMAEIMQAAPNVREMLGKFRCSILDSVVQLNLTHAMKEFYFKASRSFLKISMKLARSAPKFQLLLISTASFEENQPSITEWTFNERMELNTILSLILTSSVNTLEKFAAHQLDLIRLDTLGLLPVFHNVHLVKLIFDPAVDQHEGYLTLRKLDWEHYFPNLKIISFIIYSHCPEEREFFINDVFRNRPEEFTCRSVTKFLWNQKGRQSPDLINFFQELFPNVNEFTLEDPGGLLEICQTILSPWEHLKCISIVKVPVATTAMLDCLICGVSFDEYKRLLLRNLSNEDLDNLEIVPQKFSLLNLKCLKKLVFKFNRHSDDDEMGISIKGPFRLSHHLIFQKNPNLEVEIYRDVCSRGKRRCRFSMELLKPHVKVLNESDYNAGPQI